MEDEEAHRILINLRKKKIIRFIWIIAVSTAAAIFIYALSQYINSTKSEPNEDGAYSAAQIYIKDILKKPETAVFPDAGDIRIFCQDSLWWVLGFVDAMNDSGKLNRSHITVSLRFHPETGEWNKKGISVTNLSIFKEQKR